MTILFSYLTPALQESDEESEAPQSYTTQTKSSSKFTYPKRGMENNIRLSQSCLSENCSSPNDQCDGYKSSFDDNDGEGSSPVRPSFGTDTNDNTFYNKQSSQFKADDNKFEDMDEAFTAEYSSKSKRMMSNMGYKPGKGLGKFEHGRTAPVEASTQKGRRGLGLKPSIVGEVPQDFKWTPDETKSDAKEEVVSYKY